MMVKRFATAALSRNMTVSISWPRDGAASPDTSNSTRSAPLFIFSAERTYYATSETGHSVSAKVALFAAGEIRVH